MKKIIAVLLLLTLALTACTALADTTKVVYNGKKAAEQFTVISAEPNDLFDNFKNLLPGDTVEQKIEVVNNSKSKIRIYMRALDPVVNSDYPGFLDKMWMTVNTKKTEIFDAVPGQKAQLENWTLLGTFKKKGAATLDVDLYLPFHDKVVIDGEVVLKLSEEETLDNDYQFAEGAVVWEFKIEEIPDDDSPDTGDDFVMTLWLGAAAALLAAIAVVLVLLKRRRNEA